MTKAIDQSVLSSLQSSSCCPCCCRCSCAAAQHFPPCSKVRVNPVDEVLVKQHRSMSSSSFRGHDDIWSVMSCSYEDDDVVTRTTTTTSTRAAGSATTRTDSSVTTSTEMALESTMQAEFAELTARDMCQAVDWWNDYFLRDEYASQLPINDVDDDADDLHHRMSFTSVIAEQEVCLRGNCMVVCDAEGEDASIWEAHETSTQDCDLDCATDSALMINDPCVITLSLNLDVIHIIQASALMYGFLSIPSNDASWPFREVVVLLLLVGAVFAVAIPGNSTIVLGHTERPVRPKLTIRTPTKP